MMQRYRVWIAVVVIVIAWSAAAQDAGQLPTLEQFMKIRAPGDPTLAPDGRMYVRDWPDGVNQLYTREPGARPGDPFERLTDFEDGVSGYSLSPDGRWIVLAVAIGGSEQNDLHLLNTTTRQFEPLLTNPAVVYGLNVWLPDSSGFLYSANDTSPADFHLYRFNIATRESTKILAREGYWRVADITDDLGRALIENYRSISDADAYELDLATGALTRISIGGAETFNEPGGYLPGGNAAVVISDHGAGIPRLFVRDLETGEVTKPLPALDSFEIEGGDMNEARTLAAIIYNEDGYRTMRLYRLPGFEEIELPEIDKGLTANVDLRGDRLTWTLNNARTPGLAYAWEVGSSREPRQLTLADTQGIDLSRFLLPKLVRYKSFDGLEIPAFLFLPTGYTEGEAVPFVINYHGGPEGQHRPRFSAMTQFLLTRGFGVMQPNVRGSTGFGREFHMLDNYRNRWDSVRDGVEAARWLVANGYAQRGRIASWGGSYGGFMAVATVIEGADVFGAGVDIVGIVNFQTFLEQTKDYRRKLREAEYGPLEDTEFLASISPIHRIDEIEVPMMIAHGLNDPRVPVGEAMQLAVELQKRGYDPELVFFPDEGHGFAKLENRLLYAERMVKFLKETIGK